MRQWHLTATWPRHTTDTRKYITCFILYLLNSSWLNCVIPIIEMLFYFDRTPLRRRPRMYSLVVCVSVSMFAYTVTVWHPTLLLFPHLISRSLLHAAIPLTEVGILQSLLSTGVWQLLIIPGYFLTMAFRIAPCLHNPCGSYHRFYGVLAWFLREILSMV